MDSLGIEQRAQTLIQQLATGCQSNNLGSATVAVYDTAWVSMVSKFENGHRTWLFPECFHYLLETQLPDGGWESQASLDDRLLHTLAALLAMKKHISACGPMRHPDLADLEGRISKATAYIQNSLHCWTMEENLHVGFEVLLPAHLSMLQKEGLAFEFPERGRLERLSASKLANFDPEVLYHTPTTSLHSLEAFLDQIDFDKLGHHKTFGSMMASPSSTAAYLMYSSIWDTDAELYLRNVIKEGSGKDSGAVPSVFPMPVYEISWVRLSLNSSASLHSIV